MDNAPDTSSMALSWTIPYHHKEKASEGLYSSRTGFHYIDDPTAVGPYIQQDNIRFYHTICKCTNNIREVIG
jgi:hypothetical protein